MDLIDKIFRLDYSKLELKPVEQLLFLRISYYVSLGGEFISIAFPITYFCKVCNCTRPTVHAALARLEELGLILIDRKPGSNNNYSLNFSTLEPLFPEIAKPVSKGFFSTEDFPSFDDSQEGVSALSNFKERPLLSKNQSKRKRKNRKNRK
jgi:hypothetical protein